ncbi:MARVEL domain-containing protein [Caenorhabditis elegans]|uniref:MARVEL domain-containing protein n=2 Tax=Caenorhabditis elegans TaxID=6239 RepID=H8W3X4_CAEEL|nr:MARVEL domain-containing protein [Caenorhabditis elegans]CCG28275.2 MARVEL domain-containing protein [Caenorhabditis elegans]
MSSENEDDFQSIHVYLPERSTKVTFADEEMSRLRSDTFIKPGSESSFDSEDLNSRRYRQELESYCGCANVSALGALIVSGVVSIAQAISHFVLMLYDCDLRMIDMAFAIWPIVTVTIALVFSYFSYSTHSSTSLKPYIAHHIVMAISYCFCLFLFAMFAWKQHFFVEILSFCSSFSTLFSHLEETDGEKKLRIAGFLSSQLLVSLFCLHLSGPLFSWLDTEKKLISTEGTEAI